MIVDKDKSHDRMENFLFLISLLINLFFFLTWAGIDGLGDRVKAIDVKCDKIIELMEKKVVEERKMGQIEELLMGD